ncbi:hypothetical protein ILUMI_12784 [Ignelater luminosus]|uniref:Uncharacterized protein n=1 Tax=Ignelater luminosus TaxID=2038154 RepID=A0A8K0CTJ1_IGNLU|nr:hypothetical protein ILUMI_12784 [Ignelater luminosus]
MKTKKIKTEMVTKIEEKIEKMVRKIKMEKKKEKLKKKQQEELQAKKAGKPPKYLNDFETSMMAALSAGNLISCVSQSYEEAEKDETWKEAINKELSSLQENDTWELVKPLQVGRCKMGF